MSTIVSTLFTVCTSADSKVCIPFLLFVLFLGQTNTSLFTDLWVMFVSSALFTYFIFVTYVTDVLHVLGQTYLRVTENNKDFITGSQ